MHLAHGLDVRRSVPPRRPDPAGRACFSITCARPIPISPTGSSSARADPGALDARAHSDLLIAAAPHLEDFIAELFGIRAEVAALAARHHELAPLYSVQAAVRAAPCHEPDQARRGRAESMVRRWKRSLPRKWAARSRSWDSRSSSRSGSKTKRSTRELLELAARYAAWAAHTPAGRERHRHGRPVQGPGQARLLPPGAAAARTTPPASAATPWVTCAGAKASSSPTPAPTSSARWTRPTTASGAMSRAATPARTA